MSTPTGLTAGSLDVLVSPLNHGTEAEHRATLSRAKAAGVTMVWSGDIRKSRYLAENLRFAVQSGILTIEFVECDQESGWKLKWANAQRSATGGQTKEENHE